MSALAEMLTKKGHKIAGSDMQNSSTIERLKNKGIKISIGHDPKNMPQRIDQMVISAAVKTNNPQVVWAQKQNIKIHIHKYAETLGKISENMDTIAVAGTHGKSSTSAWLAYTLKNAGRNPNFVIGADTPQLDGSSGVGTSNILVAEACEYDRSFLHLKPHIATILNVEADHLDYYRNIDDITEAFTEFARQIRPGGLLVTNANDPIATKIIPGTKTRCEKFNIDGKGDWQAKGLSLENGCGRFEILYNGLSLGNVQLTLAGRHNVENALAVAAMAKAEKLADEQIRSGLQEFGGVDRRMTLKGQYAGVTVIDDYAHHPTEIKATLQAIKQKYRPKRLFCAFQPHQHSRTRFLLDEFASSFNTADIILLPEIYFVRDSENLRKEVTAGQLAEKIQQNGKKAKYLESLDNITEYLCQNVGKDELVVTMGAGDIWKVADGLIQRLRKYR